nr:terpene synthase class II [Tectona grandis]
MSFASPTNPLFRSYSNHGSLQAALHIPATSRLARSSAGVICAPWKLPVKSNSLLQCNAISKAPIGGDMDDILSEHNLEDGKKDTHKLKEPISDKVRELVMFIQSILRNMDDGAISVSPYDTAWVALVEDIGGSGEPQFPSSLEWISNNQLADGSWGDRDPFLVYDRIINTLACVVALTSWKMHPDKCDKGISFIRENIYKLDDEKEEQMPIGFEVVFPSLIEKAKKLNIDIPYDSPGLQKIYGGRDLKITRIPWDILHTRPTTLLFSLEGMTEVLDWRKLLKLQATDGSFHFSPASTAFALQQTKDENCLKYLLKLVQKFNGGVPNVYPVDLFERNWVADRLQRLGISRYFKPEIEECISYSHRYWSNDKGTFHARNSEIQDVDDTAMAFRLLRLQGYDVSPDAFKQFENGGEFVCFAGQSSQAVTGIYNLYRASQVMFPGEKILATAKGFSTKFLQGKRANNELIDKWIITKDLPGEVGYALDVPWYASLPRVEARFFIEQYGGDDDVWIGKTLYRMLNVNNNSYLELAKLDFNNCQAVHQQEWKIIQQWYAGCSLGEFWLSERSLLLAYYIAAASIFEPEKSAVRLAWAKTAILVKTIASQHLSREQKHDFVREFEHGSILNNANGGRYKTRNSLVKTLIETVNELSLDAVLMQDRDIHQQLYHAWLAAWEEGGDAEEGGAELFVQTLNLCHGLDESSFFHPKYQQLLEVTSRVCHQLHLLQNREVQETEGCMTESVQSGMQEIAKLVLTKSSGDLDSRTKQNFLSVARSFYYTVHCHPRTIDLHIAKVLFERVVKLSRPVCD